MAVLGALLSCYRMTPLVLAVLVYLAGQFMWVVTTSGLVMMFQELSLPRVGVGLALLLWLGSVFYVVPRFVGRFERDGCLRVILEWLMLIAGMVLLRQLLALTLTPMSWLNQGGPCGWPLIVPLIVARIYAKLGERTARSFSMAYFRPFRKAQSRRARTSVGAILGAYGHLRVLSDVEYELGRPWSFYGVSEDVLVRPAGAEIVDDGVWEKRVRQIVEEVDAAVIDISAYSPNLEFEMTVARRALGIHRLIFICDPFRYDSRWGEVTAEPGWDPGWPVGTLRRPIRVGLLFRLALFWRLAALRASPRRA